MIRLIRHWLKRPRVTPPRSAITLAMQQKMARSLATLITSGGVQSLPKARQMAKGFQLTRRHFEELATPPEEDGAKWYLTRIWR